MQLNAEQIRIVNNKPSGHVLVRGVAGSGKTTVAVHRIPMLLAHYCFEKNDKILLVTYNKTLQKYIEHIYGKISEERIPTFDSLVRADDSCLKTYTVDGIMYKLYKRNIKRKNLKLDLLTDNNERRRILIDCILTVKKIYSDVKLIEQRNSGFLLDEIEWIKSCNYTELSEYQSVDRTGRSSNEGDGPQKLRKNSRIREAIFELMTFYNKAMREKGKIDFNDMALIALEEAREHRAYDMYTHIIIDESQDLTRVQLMVLKELYSTKNHSSIMFVADTAQSIYPNAWLGNGRSFTSVGFDMTGKSSSLAKNYRTTTQIAQAAYSLIENDTNVTSDDNFVKPSLIDKQGKYPCYKRYRTNQEEANHIANLIKDTLIKKYNYGEISIIARNKKQLDYLGEYLEKHNVPFTIFKNKEEIEFKSNKVKLLTMHSIKGLEFKVVIVASVNKKLIPAPNYNMYDDKIHKSQERKLLYVGMTRATEQLFITSSETPSEFIDEINYKYLRVDPDKNFKKFYRMKLDNYMYKRKVADLYSEEEVVRQWVLKELNESYKYPYELIDLEYTVSNFSQLGKVDVCVSVYKNKRLSPYIFIETKRRGARIEDALQQVKSYMAACEECQYGVATDGNEIIIVNRENEIIDNIPLFNVNMIPSSIEKFKYIELDYNRSIEFLRDSSVENELMISTEGIDEELSADDIRKIPVFNEIAAGAPIFINETMEGSFGLPRKWFSQNEDYFILKIRGNSMIDAQIDNGDHVVIKKQNTFNNREIIAVDIDGNATLKRVMKMGDLLILISENSEYEPMQVSGEQVSVIGKAVGVIKEI